MLAMHYATAEQVSKSNKIPAFTKTIQGHDTIVTQYIKTTTYKLVECNMYADLRYALEGKYQFVLPLPPH